MNTIRRLHAAVIAIAALAGPAAADGAVGTWKTAVNDAGRFLHVAIAPCAAGQATLCGTIVKAVGATDPAALVGKRILWDMAPNGADKWNNGRIWAPDDDKTYRSRMALSGAGLKVEGCVAVFCRGQTWTKLP